MVDPVLLYLICLFGAAGLYLLVRPAGPGRADAGRMSTRAMRTVGAVLGVAALGGLLIQLPASVRGAVAGDEPAQPVVHGFMLVFAVVAVMGAVRMVASTRPVYAALWFVIVVLASAALFLVLEAEFLAFALVIVYAGAILITYMFVLMLAQQSPDPADPAGQAAYDRSPREPVAGMVVGLLLIALLTRLVSEGVPPLMPRVPDRMAAIEAWERLESMPGHLRTATAEALVAEASARGVTVPESDLAAVRAGDVVPVLEVDHASLAASAVLRFGDGRIVTVPLNDAFIPDNVQSVGLALITRFPASLEIAGIILLMAMFGAVILARRQIELTEDEKREAAGMARLGHHDEAGEGAGPGEPGLQGEGLP